VDTSTIQLYVRDRTSSSYLQCATRCVYEDLKVASTPGTHVAGYKYPDEQLVSVCMSTDRSTCIDGYNSSKQCSTRGYTWSIL